MRANSYIKVQLKKILSHMKNNNAAIIIKTEQSVVDGSRMWA